MTLAARLALLITAIGADIKLLKNTQVFKYGDIKTGIQTIDHNGWVKLDGRLKSSLTATQQAQANSLSIGVNLPNAANTVLMQNNAALGSVTGSMDKTIAQNQLPNVSPAVTIYDTVADMNASGDHQHFVVAAASTGDFYSNRINNFAYSLADTTNQGSNAFSSDLGYVNRVADQAATSKNGSHTHAMNPHKHTAAVSSINGGVPQQSIDITPRSLSINCFIYLGT